MWFATDVHCRIAVLVVGDMPEIKIYVSTEDLFIPYNQFLCAETNFCAFFDCDQKLPKRSNISVTPEVFNVWENMSDIETWLERSWKFNISRFLGLYMK